MTLDQLFKDHKRDLKHPMPGALRAELETIPARASRRIRMRWVWPASVAAALLIGLGLGRDLNTGAGADRFAQEVVAGHVRSLMANHLTDVTSTDQHTVKPWFEGRLDFGPDVRTFPQEPLIGGRLDYIGNRPVAALVYRHAQHVINVYEWPVSDSDSRPRLSSRRGFQLFSWTHSGLAYWAVSDLNAADLQKFVGLWE
jgi:anti-sigma factor RsiW